LKLRQCISTPSWFLTQRPAKQTSQEKYWDDQKPGIDAQGKVESLNHRRMGKIERGSSQKRCASQDNQCDKGWFKEYHQIPPWVDSPDEKLPKKGAHASPASGRCCEKQGRK
jgi:hypothetical protein